MASDRESVRNEPLTSFDFLHQRSYQVMATFLHLAPHTAIERIRKLGIKPSRLRLSAIVRRAVFCVPVVPSHYHTFRWLRELRRWSHGEMVGVQFRIPDSEPVIAGCYPVGSMKIDAIKPIKAAAVVQWSLAHPDDTGHEVLIPRRILPEEITRFRHVRQTVGWRYSPEAHGKRPCPCDFCQAGQRFKLRQPKSSEEQLTKTARMDRVRRATSSEDLCSALGELNHMLRSKPFRNSHELEFLLTHDDPEVLCTLAEVLGTFRDTNAKRMLRTLCRRITDELGLGTNSEHVTDMSIDLSAVIDSSVCSLTMLMKNDARVYLGELADHPLVKPCLDEHLS